MGTVGTLHEKDTNLIFDLASTVRKTNMHRGHYYEQASPPSAYIKSTPVLYVNSQLYSHRA
jgi:hypothetical protein